MVKQGTGVCFLPEDLHSIHIQAPLVNFHMYGLGLDQLHRREYYKAEEGPGGLPGACAISAKRVSERLAGSDELALLDVREQGVHYRGHPFFACSAPLSRLELMIGDLVPRKDAPIVVLDGGDEGLAEKAAN